MGKQAMVFVVARNLCHRVLALCSFHHAFKNLFHLRKQSVIRNYWSIKDHEKSTFLRTLNTAMHTISINTQNDFAQKTRQKKRNFDTHIDMYNVHILLYLTQICTSGIRSSRQAPRKTPPAKQEEKDIANFHLLKRKHFKPKNAALFVNILKPGLRLMISVVFQLRHQLERNHPETECDNRY